MKAAERAALMGLAAKLQRLSLEADDRPCRGEFESGLAAGYDNSADELRALLAEFEREDGDGPQ